MVRFGLLASLAFSVLWPFTAAAQQTVIDDAVLPEIGQEIPLEAPERILPAQTVPVSDDDTQIPTPLLTIDQDVLFKQSLWGKRAQAEIDEQGQALQAENDRLAAELSAQEAKLTEQRPTMDAAEFRRQAEAFDLHATTVRRERAQAVADLNARAEADQSAFYKAALPIMGEVMKLRGAAAILDRRTVFVAADSVDITAELVTRLDQGIGDGSEQSTLIAPVTSDPSDQNRSDGKPGDGAAGTPSSVVQP